MNGFPISMYRLSRMFDNNTFFLRIIMKNYAKNRKPDDKDNYDKS